ncbi:metallophosphoesterase [Rhabdobacter roseus]|uniref:Putative phosphodiesterase n=1 Tax=Rhabdobacter roseus TaxID=1655419 RepID=A0A840U6N4_9BACT|nr:metallophosphoesterase family protein [Rhabdobacter roseus]MBB5287479.1 putative phosphodiesterase [Rhabdobacter roseus]
MKNKNIKRRTFLSGLSKAGLIGALPVVNLEAKKSPVAEPNVFLTAPYLQTLSAQAVTIMWVNSNKAYNWVEINKKGETPRKVTSAKHGLNQAYNRVNKIRVTGLTADTDYEYRVFSREILSFKPYKVTFGETIEQGPFTFKTPAEKEDEISFVVFNDLHNHPAIITEMLQKFAPEKDYDFVVYNGDAFDFCDGEGPILSDLIAPSNTMFSTSLPFVMVQGNHEPRGNFARQMFDYFDYPEERCYYAFTRGPVRFVVLDSGEDKPDSDDEYSGLVAFDPYREEQAQWLASEIQNPAFKKAAFRVVFIHIPMFEGKDWHGREHCAKLFNPLLNKGKVDLAISGHTHRYAARPANPATHHYPVLVGGGWGTGPGPAKGGTRTIIKVQATAKQLDAKMYIDDGTVVGSFDIARRGTK